MRSLTGFLLVFCSSLVGCGVSPEEHSEASMLLQHSLEAHGSLKTYQQMQSLRYQKTTVLFDSMGAIESTLVQDHFYQFSPTIAGSIKWMQAESDYQIDYMEGHATLSINQLPQQGQEESSLSSVSAAHFVLFQPFKLADAGTRFQLNTKRHLLDGKDYTTLHPIYDGESSDKWWFYVRQSDHLLVANLVQHNERLSFIENIAYDSTTGLVLHKHRKSYFTDSTLEKKVLRAEYFYDDYEINK